MTGGSGLYVDAVCQGIDDMPAVAPELRQQLNERLDREGLASLVSELQNLDPEYHAVVDRQNPQRIVRALEICFSTGKPYSSFRQRTAVERPFKLLKLGLEMPRAVLYERIDRRMDLMIEAGLFEEAERLYPFKDKNALQTVGYKEIYDYLDGHYDKEEAIRLLKRNSRRYAKRQMTWFKKDPDTHWLHPKDFEQALGIVREKRSKTGCA